MGAAAATGGDDDDFQDMALSDHEGLDGPGAEALAAEIEGRDGGAAGVPSATVNQKKKARKKKVGAFFSAFGGGGFGGRIRHCRTMASCQMS